MDTKAVSMGKNIMNFMINKTEKSPDRQRKHQYHQYLNDTDTY